jgi:hypothetical protein
MAMTPQRRREVANYLRAHGFIPRGAQNELSHALAAAEQRDPALMLKARQVRKAMAPTFSSERREALELFANCMPLLHEAKMGMTPRGMIRRRNALEMHRKGQIF